MAPMKPDKTEGMDVAWVRRYCLMPHTTDRAGGRTWFSRWAGGSTRLRNWNPRTRITGWPSSARRRISWNCASADIVPAPYLARAQWVALQSEDAVPRVELKRLLRQSYDLVFARLCEENVPSVPGFQFGATQLRLTWQIILPIPIMPTTSTASSA